MTIRPTTVLATLVGAALFGTALFGAASSAAARDYVLDPTPDPTPNGEVLFHLTVPYELRDVHEDAAMFVMSCTVRIGLPRDAEGTSYSTTEYGDRRELDLTEIPVSADGFRDLSGELEFTIGVPAADASLLLNEDTRGGYRCNASLDDDPSTPIRRVINHDNSDDASAPYWARGVGSGSSSQGAVWGDIVIAGSGSEDGGASDGGAGASSSDFVPRRNVVPPPVIRPPSLPNP